MPKLTVRDIVEQGLKQDGYEGLYNTDGECGCELGDLSPLDCLSTDCVAGHFVPCPDDCEGKGAVWHFHIGKRSDKPKRPKKLPQFKDIIGLFVDKKGNRK
jgi:hypothetical protein